MPRAGKATQDPSLLSAALEGLELQKQRIEEQIAQVRSMLGGQKPRAGAASADNSAERPARRRLSAAARKRIALAQKRRWAEYRKSGAGKEKE